MSCCHSRRQLVLSLACSGVAFVEINNVTFSVSAEQLEPSSKVRVEWQVKEEQADDIKKVLPLAQTTTSGIGALIFVGVAPVPDLARAVIDVYYRYKSGGVTIDARGDPIIVQTNDRVAPGNAVVITADSSKLLQIGGAKETTPDVLSDLLAAAVKK